MISLVRQRSYLWVIALGVAIAVFVFLVPDVFAQTAEVAAVGDAGVPTTDIRIFIARLLRIVIGFLGIVFFALIVYGGILYMTSRGDAEKTKTATGVLRSAIIGLLIVLASYTITVFVLNALLRAAGLGRPVNLDDTAHIEPLSSALGVGIIQDHYPPRLGTDIPRNTKIIVTFKEPILLDSLLQTGTYDPSASVPTGQMNADNIKIFETASGPLAELDPGDAFESSEVNVSVTTDHKTAVFDPVELLGLPTQTVNYSVFLGPGMLKVLSDGETTAAAFPDGDGYLWTFTTSTIVDVTPPQVESFVPSGGGEYARNIVVQVTFNEAIDPTSATGVYEVSDTDPFVNMEVRNETAEGNPVEGTYTISNGYRTIEFVSFDQCGENACGGAIYCLPGGAEFTLVARAALLSAEPPSAEFTSTGYTGVTDVAGNSLDGGGEYGLNADGVAGGPPSPAGDLEEDNFWSDFSTTASINTDRPHITSLSPDLNQADVSTSIPIGVAFDVGMMMSTLTNSNIAVTPSPVHPMWFVVSGTNMVDTSVTPPVVTGTTAIVNHSIFNDYEDGDPIQLYYPTVNQNAQTSYQICFFPAYGPPSDCGVTETSQSCCRNVVSGSQEAVSAGSCPIPSS